MATQTLTENALLTRARASNSKEDCQTLYAEWADTYNADLADASQDYVAPFLAAETALQNATNVKGSILDAGCGTGLVGEALARGGAVTIDGLDLSPAMLRVARQTGVYRNLDIGDLTQPIEKPDDVYDVVTCAGTFTHGHVGPAPALREFLRVTKTNGIIVATILEDIWLSGGFKAEVERLEVEHLVKVASMELKDYRRGAGDKATFIVLKKIGSV
ncbi:S-adenosyl-L-methionine-dependent methyltransferase [Aspergillus sclerotioniger CBS 115572]|uniref:S-adenosyl-L-methionine-dependent methyltransferase n=1 Tax=Aspergillus sclerotioniger CBS 115572 TaxID=1450535 RepID=A0A317VSK4_9EURO|nr:S-adenosyl-L-methionine-dependent methyltransferase [Aspergillus sclerotioniger CBS 115572]PWY77316.1 S-adenosyl-L-methionine-dependent methyltransferase [Aspergillus sclerotioniger CBS 115572]